MSSSKRQCAATEEGLALIRKKLNQQTNWGWDANKNDEPLIIASRILDAISNWPIQAEDRNIYADSINPASWKRFLRGQPINARAFRAFCQTLGLHWQDVVNVDDLNPDILPLLIEHHDFQKPDPASDQSLFIRDVTVPDGSIVRPSEIFLKTWEIQNVGETLWKNRYLSRIGPIEGRVLMRSPRRVAIPETRPGESVQISVELQAPMVETSTRAIWKMIFKNGKLCFPDKYNCRLIVEINVVELKATIQNRG